MLGENDDEAIDQWLFELRRPDAYILSKGQKNPLTLLSVG
jgi:hypothetical protein